MDLRRYRSSGEPISYSIILISQGSKRPHSKASAEFRKKYFSTVKFSTQVLISLWKTLLRAQLTSHSSTFLHALHNICATASAFQVGKKFREQTKGKGLSVETKRRAKITTFKRRSGEYSFGARGTRCFGASALFSTTSAVSGAGS